MIKVEDNNDKLDLYDLIVFLGSVSPEFRWEIYNLEYSGSAFKCEKANVIEKKSKNGIFLSHEDFASFVSTIEQVIEGLFILREENAFPNKGQKDAVIKVLISDGSFWEVGGKRAHEFIDSVGLIYLT